MRTRDNARQFDMTMFLIGAILILAMVAAFAIGFFGGVKTASAAPDVFGAVSSAKSSPAPAQSITTEPAPKPCCKSCSDIARLVGHMHSEIKQLQATMRGRGKRLVRVEKRIDAIVKFDKMIAKWKKSHR